jgi:predicted nucleotidyltransferase
MFQQLLERIAAGLDARGLPYMVIGGQAVLLYGEPRLTRDIDITLGVGPERWRELLEMSQALGWQVLVETPEEFVRQTMVLPCLDPSSGIRIDFIFSLSSYEQQALERARPVTVGRATVRYASLEDLVIHKVIAGRPRDLEDVRTMLLKNPQADQAYIRRWLKEFEAGLGEPFLKRLEGAIGRPKRVPAKRSKRKR